MNVKKIASMVGMTAVLAIGLGACGSNPSYDAGYTAGQTADLNDAYGTAMLGSPVGTTIGIASMTQFCTSFVNSVPSAEIGSPDDFGAWARGCAAGLMSQHGN